MPLQFIAVIIFIVIMFLMILLWKKTTLDKLVTLEGERVLFEEYGLKVEQGGPFRGAVFFKCLVRVTDKRIIIAQRFFFLKDKYAIKHVIGYNLQDGDKELLDKVKQKYFTVEVDRSNLRIEKDPNKKGNGFIVTIEIPQSQDIKSQYITFITNYSGEYKKIFLEGA